MDLFRRIKSPREIRNPTTPGVVVVVEQQTTVEEAKEKSLSGHRRHKSDELPKILENRESDVLKTVKEIQPPPELPPRNRVGSGGSITHVTPGWRRTQSSGTMSVSFKSTGHLPRLPPQQDYFVPADTLKNIKNPINGHGAGVVVVHPPTQQEKRNKHMHQIIMSHNAPGFRESNKRKSRSMDKLIDICDYSVPFDFIQDPEKNNDKSEGIVLVKSKTPELPPKPKGGTSENTTHTLPPKVKGNAPVKPSKLPNHGKHKTDGFDSSHCGSDPPRFAPPPPPPPEEEEEDIEDPELTMYNSSSPLSPSPTINRVSDYEEPWDSRIRNLINPGKGSRRHRSEAEPKVVTTGLTPTFDPYKSPRTQRSQSNTHESSPEPDPPRSNSRNHNTSTFEYVPPEHGNTPSPPPLPESSRPRVNTDTHSLPPPAYPIETSVPLEDQLWYHGKIKRDQAEDILLNQPDFSFLVRNSESSKMDFSLSIRDRTSPAAQGFIHLRIQMERAGYVLGQFSAPFNSVPDCIAYYTQQPLTIKHINHRRLGFPVGKINFINRMD